MKKLVIIMLSVIALTSCGNSVEGFKDDLIVCFKNANAMTSDLAHQLIKDYGKDAILESASNCVDMKLDSIVRTAYKPLVEKYGEEYVLEFLVNNVDRTINGSKEEIEKKLATIDCFYYTQRMLSWYYVFNKIVIGDEMGAKDYEWKSIRDIKLAK